VAALALLAVLPGVAHATAVDSDHDGVPDSRDQCADSHQLQAVPAGFSYRPALSERRRSGRYATWPVDEQGCELDQDGDGVIDSLDYCIDDSPQALSSGVADNGCPRQSDGDGTPDWRDRCPATPTGVATDRDGCAVAATLQ